MNKINKKYLIALYANIGLENKKNKFEKNQKKNQKFTLPHTFLFELDKIIEKTKDDYNNATYKKTVDEIKKDLESPSKATWINLIRNYFSHIESDKVFKTNKQNYKDFEDNKLENISNFINKYLGIDNSYSKDIYVIIYISWFLTKQEFENMINQFDKIEFTNNEQNDIDYVFKTCKSKITRLRLWNWKSNVYSSYDWKIRLLQNINNHINNKNIDKIRINKFNCSFLSNKIFYDIYKNNEENKEENTNTNKFKIRHLYNQHDYDNPWSNKFKPFKFNLAKLTYPYHSEQDKNAKYKYLNYASLRNVMIILSNNYNEKELNNSDIFNILKNFKVKRKTNPKDSSKTKNIYTLKDKNKLMNHFNPNKINFNELSSLKMLNKILLAESGVIDGDDPKKEILSEIVPSEDDFSKLLHYCKNNKLKELKEFLEQDNNKIHDSHPLKKILWNEDNSIIYNINEYIYNYINIDLNFNTLISYFNKNNKWKDKYSKDFANAKHPKEINPEFQNQKINSYMLNIDKPSNTNLRNEIQDKRLNKIIYAWQPTIDLIYNIFKSNNETKNSKEFNWSKNPEFKSMKKNNEIVKHIETKLGKIYVPREIIKSNDNNVLSNYHIVKTKMYNTLKKLCKDHKINEDIISICKKYFDKELEIVKLEIENKYKNNSSNDNKHFRNAVLHRFNFDNKNSPTSKFFNKETNLINLIKKLKEF